MQVTLSNPTMNTTEGGYINDAPAAEKKPSFSKDTIEFPKGDREDDSKDVGCLSAFLSSLKEMFLTPYRMLFAKGEEKALERTESTATVVIDAYVNDRALKDVIERDYPSSEIVDKMLKQADELGLNEDKTFLVKALLKAVWVQCGGSESSFKSRIGDHIALQRKKLCAPLAAAVAKYDRAVKKDDDSCSPFTRFQKIVDGLSRKNFTSYEKTSLFSNT